MARADWVICAKCDRSKAPLGRSVPMPMSGTLCDDGCPGYRADPKPECRWPGEYACGPGCTRDEASK